MARCEAKKAAPTVPRHWLDPLLPAEIEAASRASLELVRRERPGEAVFVSSVHLLEDDGDGDGEDGPPPHLRPLIAVLMAHPSLDTFEVVTRGGGAVRHRVVRGVQPSFAPGEYELVRDIVRGDDRVREWCRSRGVTTDDIVVECWASGWLAPEDDAARGRLMRPLLYLRPEPGVETSNAYARPLDGLLPVVDALAGRVVRWARFEPDWPVPPAGDASAEFDAAAFPEEDRRRVARPLIVNQPEGPTFEFDGQLIRWMGWEMRVGFGQREGVMLHNIKFLGRGVARRLSANEMVVPYGRPRVPDRRKNAFDAGEDGLGNSTMSLQHGCDCAGVVRYMDACVVDRAGRAVPIPNAVCVHEEDVGALLVHNDWTTQRKTTRRDRRLLVQWTATVANYDYSFVYNFRMNGAVEVEARMTGILSTSALPPGEDSKYGTVVAPQLNAPLHQHFFVFRLDPCVDGPLNTVTEVEAHTEEPGPGNPAANAWHLRERRLETELGGARDANSLTGRHWLVHSESRRSRTGARTAYRVMFASPDVRPLMHRTAQIMKRASFLRHSLWVVERDPARRRFSSGDYPNQRKGSDGVAEWVKEDRPIVNRPLSLFINVGFTHVVAPEEWPIMCVQKAGFHLEPFGFCDRNPALDCIAPAEPGAGGVIGSKL